MKLIDFFYLLMKKMPPLKLENVDPLGIVKSLDIKDFKPELLIKQLKSSEPDTLLMQ